MPEEALARTAHDRIEQLGVPAPNGSSHAPNGSSPASNGSSHAQSSMVKLKGEWDLARREELHDLLRPLAGSLTVDLRDVTYLDSSAISVFVATHKRLVVDGGGLQLRVREEGVVRRTIEIVGLDDWIVE